MKWFAFGVAIASVVSGSVLLSDGILGLINGRSVFLPETGVPIKLAGGLLVIVLGSLLMSLLDRRSEWRARSTAR